MARPIAAVVNSDDDMIALLKHVLEARGLDVWIFKLTDVLAGRVDATRLFAERPPDLLVWDVEPPFAENATRLEKFRQSARAEDRPLVVMTTRPPPVAQRLAPGRNCRLVEKPFEVRDFEDAVGEVLGGTAEPART